MTTSIRKMFPHLAAPIAHAYSERSAAADDVAIVCYEREVPEFVGPELDKLYGNLFSSMMQFDISGLDHRKTWTYVARRQQTVLALFLFHKSGGRVRVLNEAIHIPEAELTRFVDYVFASWRSVSVVQFNAIEVGRVRLPYPFQQVNLLEDIAMSLPATPQDYHASLGKNTRRNVKRYGDRLLKAFPSYRFRVVEHGDIAEGLIRQIIGFNHARMASKNKASNLGERSVRRVTQLAQQSGLVGVVEIDGRVCAGAISYRVGEHYFLDILAHDPAFDEYWAGILCCYHTICECILHGGREFHFLWGRYDYKFTLGASMRELDGLAIYRSPLHMLRHAGIASQLAYDGALRQLKLWMESEESQQAGRWSRYALRCATSMRELKRALSTRMGR